MEQQKPGLVDWLKQNTIPLGHIIRPIRINRV